MDHETTLDDVLGATLKGFQTVQDQMVDLKTSLEAKINKLDDKFDNKVDGLDRRLDKLDGKFVTLTNVLERKQVINEDEKRLIFS